MRNIAIELNKVEVVKIDPRTHFVELQLDYSVNKIDKNVLIKTEIKNCEGTASKVLKYLRKKETPDLEEDDIISNLVVVNLENQEKIEEKLGYFFGKILDRVNEVVSKKSADNFLNMYCGLNGQKIEFSKSI